MTTTKRALSAMAAAVAGLLTMLGLAAPAFAASDDVIDSMDAAYVVRGDGSVQVQQTLVYRFGPSSSRHGIYVYVPTREPYVTAKDKDRVYRLSDVSVTSPDSSVSTQFTTNEVEAKGGETGRNKATTIKVGSSDRTVQSPTATYTLNYVVSRAINNNDHGDEFYWDLVTPDWPRIRTYTAQITTPTDIVKTNCVEGALGSSGQGSCVVDPASGGKQTSVSATDVGVSSGVSVSTTFAGGAVQPNTPELVDSPAVQQRRSLYAGIATFAASTVAAIAGAFWFARTRGRDERFLGVPPGLVPTGGQADQVGRDNKPQIPVQFNPPPMSVGQAGMLDDGSVDVADTTATLLSLAVQGFVQISQPAKHETLVRCLRADAPRYEHEQVLMQSLFGSSPQPGQTVDAGAQGTLTRAHDAVSASLTRELTAAGYYKRVPRALGGSVVNGCLPALVMGAIFISGTAVTRAMVLLIPLIPLAVAFAWASKRAGRGQRSALGRAMQDQNEGFRRYIATAEADQIRFEEGEDIFSKYLPWATMYGLADRWTKVCRQLVEMGRMPDVAPSWYYGPWYGFHSFNPVIITDSVTDSFTPEPPSSSSGGFGSGGSGFSGGSVGGGGGGGGAGSW